MIVRITRAKVGHRQAPFAKLVLYDAARIDLVPGASIGRASVDLMPEHEIRRVNAGSGIEKFPELFGMDTFAVAAVH